MTYKNTHNGYIADAELAANRREVAKTAGGAILLAAIGAGTVLGVNHLTANKQPTAPEHSVVETDSLTSAEKAIIGTTQDAFSGRDTITPEDKQKFAALPITGQSTFVISEGGSLIADATAAADNFYPGDANDIPASVRESIVVSSNMLQEQRRQVTGTGAAVQPDDEFSLVLLTVNGKDIAAVTDPAEIDTN